MVGRLLQIHWTDVFLPSVALVGWAQPILDTAAKSRFNSSIRLEPEHGKSFEVCVLEKESQKKVFN